MHAFVFLLLSPCLCESPGGAVELHGGVYSMPRFGLGVYRSPPGDVTYDAVAWALELGYRLIDTAAMYGNEEAVGRAIRDSGIAREDIFVTTKLNTPDHGFTKTIEACKKSLELLGIEYIDLYLIHSPYGGKIVETYDALLKLRKDGLIRSVGVSNFGVKHLEALKRHGREMPSVNQFEMHPMIFNEREKLVQYCEDSGIVITAYGSIFFGREDFLGASAIAKIGEHHQKTPAQILLRWGYQKGFALIPKSVSSKQRQQENMNIFDFELSGDELVALEQMHGNLGAYWNPVKDAKVDLGDTDSFVNESGLPLGHDASGL